MLRFNNSLEGPAELSKAVIVMVMVCYSERTQTKISHGKRHIGQSTRETTHEALPIGVMWTVLISPSSNV